MSARKPKISREDIIRHCATATGRTIIGGSQHGNLVIEMHGEYAVKYGVGVFELEFRNQLLASTLLDPQIVRVPKVYDFFTDELGRGYLLMDKMSGKRMPIIEDEADLEALARILRHFESFTSSTPGPLAQPGISYALLFGESDHPSFRTISSVEEWFNHRLMDEESRIILSQFKLTLCHLDLFPRNILWQSDEPPCLLDWLSAGYWPRIFERCSHMILSDYGSSPAIFMNSMNEEEATQAQLVLRVWSNAQRYSFSKSDVPDDLKFDSPPPPVPEPPPYNEEWLYQHSKFSARSPDTL